MCQVGALFSGTECLIETYRAKNDIYNGVAAGCSTGGILAAKGIGSINQEFDYPLLTTIFKFTIYNHSFLIHYCVRMTILNIFEYSNIHHQCISLNYPLFHGS